MYCVVMHRVLCNFCEPYLGIGHLATLYLYLISVINCNQEMLIIFIIITRKERSSVGLKIFESLLERKRTLNIYIYITIIVINAFVAVAQQSFFFIFTI